MASEGDPGRPSSPAVLPALSVLLARQQGCRPDPSPRDGPSLMPASVSAAGEVTSRAEASLSPIAEPCKQAGHRGIAWGVQGVTLQGAWCGGACPVPPAYVQRETCEGCVSA